MKWGAKSKKKDIDAAAHRIACQVAGEYAGCRSAEAGFEVPVVRVEELKGRSSNHFWKHFVAPRRPVLIKGHPLEADWRASGLWTNDYLKKHVGSAEVLVEVRDGAQDSYGQGKKVKMTFGSFLDKLNAGSTNLYMSTQPCGKDADGFPKLFVPPVSGLQQDFPLRPEVMGSLVPQQINMWMGAAPEGSSSGLHHDFHDNLYMLLRGAKRFRLFDPSQAPNMYTRGKLRLMHANGRMVYQGQGEIRPDGLEVHEVQRWERVTAAETQIEAARTEAESAGGGGEAADRLAAAEQALDDLLEDALDDAYMEMDDFDEDGEEGMEADEPGQAPPSFCAVDLTLEDSDIAKKWPLFPGKAAAASVRVEAGDMLYLPAGWFHEVTSFGQTSQGGHLALNYWFYPPSNLDPSPQGFSKPYTSDFLPSMWQQKTALSSVRGNSHNHRADSTAAAAAARTTGAPRPAGPEKSAGSPGSVTTGSVTTGSVTTGSVTTGSVTTGSAATTSRLGGSAGSPGSATAASRSTGSAASAPSASLHAGESDVGGGALHPGAGGVASPRKRRSKKRGHGGGGEEELGASPLAAQGGTKKATARWQAAAQLLAALFGRKKKKRTKPVWWWRGRRHHLAVYVPKDA